MKSIEKEISTFVFKCKISDLISTIIKNSLNKQDIIIIFFTVSSLFQDDNKSILKHLKSSLLYKKEFLLSLFNFVKIKEEEEQQEVDPLEFFELKEFIFIVNIANTLTSENKIAFLEEFIEKLMNTYDKLFNLYLKEEEKEENFSYDDLITSLFFFCDLCKNNELQPAMLLKILKFVMNILSSQSVISVEQKEILIKYYQELLNNFKINNTEDFNLIITYFLKIFYDDNLTFISSMIMGTILINTKKEILIKNFENVLHLLSLLVSGACDKERIKYFLKFIKQIYLPLNNERQFALIKSLKITLMNTINKLDNEIKQDQDLVKKLEKLSIKMMGLV